MTLDGVDPSRVAMWGIGHASGAVMIAADDDPRVKAVIMNMPFGAFDMTGFPPGTLDRMTAAPGTAASPCSAAS